MRMEEDDSEEMVFFFFSQYLFPSLSSNGRAFGKPYLDLISLSCVCVVCLSVSLSVSMCLSLFSSLQLGEGALALYDELLRNRSQTHTTIGQVSFLLLSLPPPPLFYLSFSSSLLHLFLLPSFLIPLLFLFLFYSVPFSFLSFSIAFLLSLFSSLLSEMYGGFFIYKIPPILHV